LSLVELKGKMTEAENSDSWSGATLVLDEVNKLLQFAVVEIRDRPKSHASAGPGQQVVALALDA
jgi:hypothetical protein